MGALWEELTDARNELERRRVADADAEKEGSHGTRERRADGEPPPQLAGGGGGANLLSTVEYRFGESSKVRSIHWLPYDHVRVVNADP